MNILVILGHRLEDDGHMSSILVERLELGLKTFNKVDAEYICVTGGMPNKLANCTEASKMYNWLVKKGFPKEKIIVEDQSNTTIENAKNLAKVLSDKRVEKIYLCSSKYHFTRLFRPKAHRVFKKAFKNSEIVKVYE